MSRLRPRAASPRQLARTRCQALRVGRRQALEKCEGNKTKASALLGISERSMWYKLKKYGLN